MKNIIYILILINIMCLTGCNRDDVNNNTDTVICAYDSPMVSPSGKYLLEILNGYNGVVHYKRFNISSLEKKYDPEVIYCSKDTFRIRDELYFTWDDEKDVVWVFSGDVGAFYWEENDSEWVKYEKGKKEYPNNLKKLLEKARNNRFVNGS